ncbi:DNA helicase [Enterobacter phage ATCEA23]|nr:putative DNA repair helicase [Enterobacter phage ATCEA85]QQV93496.1 DNA helicase [Enterobacter phage ATCEA23]
MATLTPIKQMIAETMIDAERAKLEKGFRPMPYDPYPFQWAANKATAAGINDYKDKGAFIVKAAVSAGKTTLISLACRRITQLRMPALVLSRQGGIIKQNAAEIRNFGVENSVFSASLGMKATTFPIICGSEKTVVNALEKQLKNFVPRFILIDECQHVNVDDIVESQLTCETAAKHPENAKLQHRAENTLAKMIENGRTGYTLIIREMQRRCREKWGRELVVIGYTGTDYRGTQPIIQENMELPGFWRRAVCDISTEFLVEVGAVVPTIYGDIDDDLTYDLSHYVSRGEEGDDEFSDADLKAMEADILGQGTKTQLIMLDVIKRTANRNAVLVTCAGKKHCKEAAAYMPPGITWGIITDDTPQKERDRLLDDAFNGKCKVIFQVGCLTTGYNVPPWDTIVILRKIGSLTLLTQLIGRGMRLLKAFHIDKLGMYKADNLVLDYGGALDDLADLYFSPFLEQYIYAKDVASGSFKTCPFGHTNGKHARRCSHVADDFEPLEYGGMLQPGERCSHWFTYRECSDFKNDRGVLVQKGCGAKNDIVSRTCSECGNTLIDPNKAIDGKAYKKDDFVDVRKFEIEPTKCGGGVVFKYTLGNKGEPDFTAYEIFWPDSDNPGAKQQWRVAVDKHLASPTQRGKMRRGVNKILAEAHLFAVPKRVTHRRIGTTKKRDVIARKIFEGGDDL